MVFSTNDVGITGHSYVKEKKISHNLYFTHCTKIYSKWIIDRNMKARLITFRKINIGENLCDHGKQRFVR